MDFYLKDKTSNGAVVITQGQESQKLLFDELDHESALFFTTRGYDRTGVVSLKSHEGRLTEATHELWLQLREGDHYTERNQILDHVDPMLALFLGKQQLDAITPVTNALELYVDKKCPQPTNSSNGDNDDRQAETAYRDCLAELPTDAQVVTYQQQARRAFEDLQAADGLDPSFDNGAAFARKLFELKLAVQSSYQYPALWTGPKSTMVLDFRLTASALRGLLTTEGATERFEQSLAETLELLLIKRNTSASKQQDQMASTLKSLAGKMAKASAIFQRRAQAYQGLDALARAASPQGMVVGEQAHLLAVDGDGSLATIAERKADVAVHLFDELVDLGGMGASAQQLAAYSLLASVPPSEMELLLSLDFKKSDNVDYPDVKLHGRGQDANLIDAGQYNLKALLGK